MSLETTIVFLFSKLDWIVLAVAMIIWSGCLKSKSGGNITSFKFLKETTLRIPIP